MNANLISGCFLNNISNVHCALVINFNDSAQFYFTTGIYCLHESLTEVWNFTSVKLTEVQFAPKWVSFRLDPYERW